jgi:hypothetical protein
MKYAEMHPEVYTADQDDLEDIEKELEYKVRNNLQCTHPFMDAFMGRVGRVVPFLPMATGNPDVHPLQG